MTDTATAPPPAPASSASPGRAVLGLVLANAAVLVVLHGVLSGAAAAAVLRFDPAAAAARPWALLTYPFVHAGPLHLALTSLLLALVGPAVARRMGPRRFLGYYLACGAGAALLALLITAVVPVPALEGAFAPALGVLFAGAWYAEDATVPLQPLPARARVRTLLAALAGGLGVAAMLRPDAALSVAHFGGMVAGYLWFRVQGSARQLAPHKTLPVRRPVMAPVRRRAEAPSTPAVARPVAAPDPPPPAPADPGELDRLLDKISAHGLDSLTPEERTALAAYAERKRRDREQR